MRAAQENRDRAETQEKDKNQEKRASLVEGDCSGRGQSFFWLFCCQDAQLPSPWHGRRQKVSHQFIHGEGGASFQGNVDFLRGRRELVMEMRRTRADDGPS